MPKKLEDILTAEQQRILRYTINGKSVRENLQHAVDSEEVVITKAGTLQPAEPRKQVNPFLQTAGCEPPKPCFLLRILYQCAYNKSHIPFSCNDCYKVRANLKTLRETMALRDIATNLAIPSKVGHEVNKQYSQCLYGGYFYTVGLKEAQKKFAEVRTAVDRHPLLGTSIPLSIKRGCSDFEIAHGPSDQWEFNPALEEVEEVLFSLFTFKQQKTKCEALIDKQKTLASLFAVAYRIGDNTYLDFTNGKRLYPEMVTYPQTPDSDEKEDQG